MPGDPTTQPKPSQEMDMSDEDLQAFLQDLELLTLHEKPSTPDFVPPATHKEPIQKKFTIITFQKILFTLLFSVFCGTLITWIHTLKTTQSEILRVLEAIHVELKHIQPTPSETALSDLLIPHIPEEEIIEPLDTNLKIPNIS